MANAPLRPICYMRKSLFQLMKHNTDLRVALLALAVAIGFQASVPAAPAPEVALPANPSEPRAVVDFNEGWLFANGNPEAAQATNFDDSQWKPVQLPHDWAIFGPFQQELNGQFGKTKWQGIAWYRKHFRLPASAKGKRIYLDFDGVMTAPKVYVNGKLAGQCDYGYMSFQVDATPFLYSGGDNVIAVVADTTMHGTRWYPGAGIYRKVTLAVCASVHVAQWGTQITTPVIKEKEAEVRIRTMVSSKLPPTKAKVALESVVSNPEGAEVGRVKSEVALQGGSYRVFDQSLTLRDVQLWDIKSPKLYKVTSVVTVDGKLSDTYQSTFGIRSMEWTAEDGFHLNGRRVQLHGVNLHHDHGPLGAAFYRRAMERQLEILKEAGVNALRTSHNVQSPELLDLCDRMGILVYNEAFDKWNVFSERDMVLKTLLDFVRRDRNHPSVICWSIGNEINLVEENDIGNAPEVVKLFTDAVRLMDPTRPVTLGAFVATALNSGIQEHLDFNDMHYSGRYAIAKKLFPRRPTLCSESAAALSTRGFYKLPLPKNRKEFAIPELQVDSYDLNSPGFGDIADVEFERMRNDRYCAGEFVWTGFDYIGEPTPYDGSLVKNGSITVAQTARSSYFGFVDLVGIPKDRYYLYRSHWAPEKTTVHLLPHWNWPDRVGKPVPVFLYTNGDEAELFLNGKSLGRRKKQVEPLTANLARNKSASASSEAPNSTAAAAADGDIRTSWRAANKGPQSWQVDLGRSTLLTSCRLEMETPMGKAQFLIKGSEDGQTWRILAQKQTWEGHPIEVTPGNFIDQPWMVFPVQGSARYVKVEFTELKEATASLRDFAVFGQAFDLDAYYGPIDVYRLRWMEVPYEPGELKAVAYKNGSKIGETSVRTAGAPAKLRLTADHTRIAATGQDLSYVLVEAVDRDGTLCPLADQEVQFALAGPGEIAGVGNGNPQSIEAFQSDKVRLFYGKAMLIVRSVTNRPGAIDIVASAEKMAPARAKIESRQP